MINPYEWDDRDGRDVEEQPLYCRGCGGYLGDFETITPDQVIWWNNWPWCVDHGTEMQRLAQSADPVNEVRR
jgi:hypothetical protein